MIRAIVTALALFAGTPVIAQTPESQTQASPAPSRPLVIAHRGASGERPEHTVQAYELAIAQGADIIEPDLVMTRDGALVDRHENEIGGTTDVAAHPEFADRRTTKVIDGETITGWFTEDFTLAEIKTLRARERLPTLRPLSAAHDGEDRILTFQEVIDIARAATVRTGRTIGVAPELKHPTFFAANALPMQASFLAILSTNGLMDATSPIVIQCFEVDMLKSLDLATNAPLLQLVQVDGGPADHPDLLYRDMLTPEGLARIAAYADAIGAESTLVVPRDSGNRTLPASALVADAHRAGLEVVVWTLRAENQFLAEDDRRGDPTAADYLALHGDLTTAVRRFQAAGVDAVFSDFPGIAVSALR